MRDFHSIDEALEGVGRTSVAIGNRKGILKTVEATEPMAVVYFDARDELRIPLKYVQVCEPGD